MRYTDSSGTSHYISQQEMDFMLYKIDNFVRSYLEKQFHKKEYIKNIYLEFYGEDQTIKVCVELDKKKINVKKVTTAFMKLYHNDDILDDVYKQWLPSYKPIFL